MRIIVYGAGAIGGALGARRFQAGGDVVLIARGAHYEALRRDGLRLVSPSSTELLAVPVVDEPGAIDWGPGDVVCLCVKSQDTQGALERLLRTAGGDVPLCCVQNGVDNERQAARLFARVYGACIQCPATHLEPGVIEVHSEPVTGVIDVGRWPHGSDDTATAIAAALEAATFSSVVRDDIMRWKHAKLLMNLTNALEALCGRAARAGPIARLLRAEAEACLRAAGIEFASVEEERARRGDLVSVREPVPGRTGGSSTWQSVERGRGSIEADYLNGEIVLLGALFGIETPVNERVRRLANELAWARRPPASFSEEALLAELTGS
ncbi:MAG TPA: 2-dehydropantoate 2-reductase [Acidimicrobiales bacterium]|nr:2-dehydropantoate 2-reductase [Acidimicrobiales bacterium]